MNTRNASTYRSLTLLLLFGLAMAGLAFAGEYANNEVALGGYCPVAYAAMGKAVEGKAEFSAEYQGQNYFLANAQAKQMFEQSPESYAVAYDGWCATAMAKGMKLESDPTIFFVHEGKTYLFSSEEAKEMLTMNVSGTIAQADKRWPEVASQGRAHS